jgi:hypothetical protein
VLPPTPPRVELFSPHASLARVESQLRDQLTFLFTYFAPSLVGDFAWVAAYRAYRAAWAGPPT